MQIKNIYILFPAGYSGTYLSWCLNKSELSTSVNTINDPINKTKSDKYGGAGTCHLYYREPTHASIDYIMSWLILHQPKDKRIYLVNVWGWFQLTRAINHILSFDRDPIIIHITADDADAEALGNLNAMTKWPLIFDIFEHTDRFGIDFYNIDDSMRTRNILVKNYNYIFTSSKSITFEDKEINKFECDQPDKAIKMMWSEDYYYFMRNLITKWFTVRNKHTPHEVNEEQFIKPYKLPKNYYSIGLKEIYQSDFPNKLEMIVSDKDIGNYNFDYVKSFHQTYIDNQSNIQYLSEIKMFRETGVLTEYLNSHPLLRALVIKNMLLKLPNDYDWETKQLNEIVGYYTNNIK